MEGTQTEFTRQWSVVWNSVASGQCSENPALREEERGQALEKGKGSEVEHPETLD